MPAIPDKARFSLDVVRARKGDCLILHFGTAKKPGLFLIDGGPSGVYQPQLRKRLASLKTSRKLGDDTPLPADVLLVSHVDDDHIKGVLDLTAELRGQKGDKEPLFLQVKSLWHNSFDDLLNTTPDQLKAEASFGAAAIGGRIELDDAVDPDVAKVLASIDQGRQLRDDAQLLGWKPNAPFKGLIMATKGAKPVSLGNLQITVIGPMRDELEALQEEHDKFLKEQAKAGKTSAAAVPAAFVDASIPNLSSIVLLVEAGGKRMLLTGDARGDKVLEGLELSGQLKKGDKNKMHVDVLKVPHHGSSNNMETIFFKRVVADHYVFSGNGEHGNPERETLEMLFEARGKEPFTLHFTYPIDEIDVERKKDWQKEQAKERKRGKAARPNWTPANNSLAALFKKVPLGKGQSMTIGADAMPHLIELLNPL